MKTGFSSLICPGWDLKAIVTNAASHGFDGVELRGLSGESHLPAVPDLAQDPDQTRGLFTESKVELVCLSSSVTLDSKSARKLAAQKADLIEFIELAGKLGCPFVRIAAGKVQSWDHRRAALSRVALALRSLVPVAARLNVTILVENGGDFADSQAAWFLADAAEHPTVQCCWNQLIALMMREPPTISIPRLARKIGMVHICDAQLDGDGVLLGYKALGQGDAEVAKQVELLKGVAYDGYLMFDWPKRSTDSLPGPEALLPEVAGFLRGCLDEKQTQLTAYSKDKNAPKFAARHLSASLDCS